MDPVSVSALVAVLSKLSSVMGEEVGKQVWQSLSAVVRRLFRRQSASREALESLGAQPDDPAMMKDLAAALAAAAQQDPSVTAELRRWLRTAEQTLDRRDGVHNMVRGDVQGSVIQARDIQGDIRLG